jgi:hypothetical protein
MTESGCALTATAGPLVRGGGKDWCCVVPSPTHCACHENAAGSRAGVSTARELTLLHVYQPGLGSTPCVFKGIAPAGSPIRRELIIWLRDQSDPVHKLVRDH